MITKVFIDLIYPKENKRRDIHLPEKKAQRVLTWEIVKILNLWTPYLTDLEIWLRCPRLQGNQVQGLSPFLGLRFPNWTCTLKANGVDPIQVNTTDQDPWNRKLKGWYDQFEEERKT